MTPNTPMTELPVDAYDAGLLKDYGGGDVGWWQYYIRAELGRAHDHYIAQIEALSQSLRAPAGEAAYGERKLYLKDGPALRLVRLRFFRDMIQSERIKVYEVFGIDKDDLPAPLTLGIEQQVFNQLFVRTAVPPVNKSPNPETVGSIYGEFTPISINAPTPEHVEGDVLSALEMRRYDFAVLEGGVTMADCATGPYCHYSEATTRIQRAERERNEARHDNSDLLAAADAEAFVIRNLRAQLADAVKAVREAAKGLDMVHNGLMDPTRPRQAVGEVCAHFLTTTNAFLSTIGEKPDAE